MKGKIAKILGVGLALALVASLSLVAAAPVAALGQPTVTVSPATISEVADYTIVFTLGHELFGKDASTIGTTNDTITITFPDDTIVAASATVSGGASIGADEGWYSADGVDANVDGTPPCWDAADVDGAVFTSVPAARTVICTLGDDDNIGAGAQVWINLSAGITNPSAVDDYTLTVKTSDETTAVESASYSITAPPIPGTVSVYNPSDTLVYQYTGTDALDAGKAGQYYGNANYTIEVGPGTYTPSNTITLGGEGLTLQSTDGAAVTIIDASNHVNLGISITADDVTVDGFTIEDGDSHGIQVGAFDGAVIQNNIVEVEAIGINLGSAATGATVSGNTIDDCWDGIYLDTGGDNTIEDNTITGSRASSEGAIVFAATNNGNTISGNTITDNEGSGIYFWFGAPDDNLIEGNTISENEGNGIVIASTVTNLIITKNDITDNIGVGIVVEKWTPASDAIKFNDITGNDTTNGYGLQNTTAVAVDATHNWWGTSVASEVAAMVNDTGAGVTDYTPFLSDTPDAVFSATAVDTGVASLDAETDVGVEVLGATGADVISAAKYIDNPGAPLDNTLAFYDVYVAGADTGTTDTVMLRFYAEDADAYDNAVLYAWSSATATWVEVIPEADFSDFGGFLHVTLNTTGATTPSTPNIGDLTELPFAVCGEEAPPEDPWVYDANEDGVIQKSEAVDAVWDYFDGIITKELAIEVLWLYFG